MGRTRLVAAAEAVRETLERHTNSRPTARAECLYDLLVTLVTTRPPPRLAALAAAGDARGLGTRLKTLTTLLTQQATLPEALYCHYRYRESRNRVLRRWQVRPRDWSYVHALADEVGRALALLYSVEDFSALPWQQRLEAERTQLTVILDSTALDDMLLCALEGLLSPKEGHRKGYEVYGACLGMARERDTARRGEGVRWHRHIYVHRALPQLSAEASYLSVSWREKSFAALAEAAQALFPHYQLVGDFHSHPYDSLAELRCRKGWLPSRGDESNNQEWCAFMRGLGETPQIAFVLAIARSRAAARRSRPHNLPYALQTNVGGCRVIIGVSRILGSGQYSTGHVELRAPGLSPP